jgi:hypothetical protein
LKFQLPMPCFTSLQSPFSFYLFKDHPPCLFLRRFYPLSLLHTDHQFFLFPSVWKAKRLQGAWRGHAGAHRGRNGGFKGVEAGAWRRHIRVRRELEMKLHRLRNNCKTFTALQAIFHGKLSIWKGVQGRRKGASHLETFSPFVFPFKIHSRSMRGSWGNIHLQLFPGGLLWLVGVGSFALLYKTLFSVLSIFSFIEGVPCVAFCVAPVACEFRRARRGLRFYLTLRVLTGTQLFRLVPDILSIFFFRRFRCFRHCFCVETHFVLERKNRFSKWTLGGNRNSTFRQKICLSAKNGQIYFVWFHIWIEGLAQNITLTTTCKNSTIWHKTPIWCNID